MSIPDTNTIQTRKSETLYIQGSTGRLYTVINRPESQGEIPLVIICHGFTSNAHAPFITDLSDAITAHGMATLRFDFNGHGRSDGKFKDMTVPNEIEDLKNVINWTRQQSWVSNLSLVGHSQGGVVASMVSGELGDDIIKAEVLVAPAAVLRDNMLKGETMGISFDPWNINEEYIKVFKKPGSEPLLLGRNYIKTALTLPIYETAAKYNGPALILQGLHDRLVPYTYAERYNEKIKNSELQLIPDEDHEFTNTSKESSRFIADWLHSKLL